MGKFYDSIPDNLVPWILSQQMFWVATAPLSGAGHVNLSPKGLTGSFHVVDEHTVWYEDLTGSGSETMSHLREEGNGRITIMFCAFEGAPRILRMFGTGKVHEFGTPEYAALLPPESRRPGSRCAIVIDVHKVGTSCGFGVPQYAFKAHRPTLLNWCAGLEMKDQALAASPAKSAKSKVPVADGGLKAYWIKENLVSIDGLPAMRGAHTSSDAPVHRPPNGEWGKDSKALPSASGAVKSGSNGAEAARLLFAFSMGLAIAAAYTKIAGCA
ncbi:hypothetical protein AcW1_000004 [Taiwanofungus camphoratus]|nr:hypothetical protein AcV5_003894 [Antrodia cinnamomea]KAI0962707.1 hypothetical protein AcW1_000004 [Antrodia cinnamomea]